MTERTTVPAHLGRVPRLTMPQLWACLAVLLPVLGAIVAPISTVDLAYHVRAGGIILDTKALPSPDPFTFTAAGMPWLDQQWGAQVVFGAIHRLGGWALLAVVRAACVGSIFWLVFVACRWSGAGTRAAAWLTLAGFGVGLVALGLRPQLLGMACLAATLAILAARERHPRLVWSIPLIVVLWANVHGSFFLGPAAVLVALLDDLVARRPGAGRLLVVGGLSAAATLIGPYGFSVWSYAVGVAADPTIRRLISEWQPTDPRSFAGAVFYGSVAGVIVLLVAIARRAGAGATAFALRAWPSLGWLLALATIGVFAERGVAWWSIGAPVALAGLLARLPRMAEAGSEAVPSVPGRTPVGSLAATGVAAAVLVAVIALVPIWRGGDPLYGPEGLLADAPRGVTEAAQSVVRPGDRIWNAQRWGSWLEFAIPDAPVAVDSRIELIPSDAWDDHLELSRGASDWSSILDRRGVTIVVASATEQAGLIPLLSESSDWRAAYADGVGAVFVRAGSP